MRSKIVDNGKNIQWDIRLKAIKKEIPYSLAIEMSKKALEKTCNMCCHSPSAMYCSCEHCSIEKEQDETEKLIKDFILATL